MDLGKPILLTQQELNEIFEDPEFDVIKRYSDALMTMYMCAFYSPILPMGMIFSVVSL